MKSSEFLLLIYWSSCFLPCPWTISLFTLNIIFVMLSLITFILLNSVYTRVLSSYSNYQVKKPQILNTIYHSFNKYQFNKLDLLELLPIPIFLNCLNWQGFIYIILKTSITKLTTFSHLLTKYQWPTDIFLDFLLSLWCTGTAKSRGKMNCF